MAKSLEIPAVVGVENATINIKGPNSNTVGSEALDKLANAIKDVNDKVLGINAIASDASKLALDAITIVNSKKDNSQDLNTVVDAVDKRIDDKLIKQSTNYDSKFVKLDETISRINSMESRIDNKTKELDDITKRALTLITAKR
jgi:hypothetical protein